MAKANRLVNESSPYLKQHAHNPVDWFPWGEEALLLAKKLNKPIFLSVGYSACHWCHVMERECFENEQIARVMNENFVNIKVDREERPDLDHIYMNVVQLMTGRGGWPMSVFLSPDQKPIFGGTYFPPTDGYGVPAFPRVLQEVTRIHRDNPPALKEQTQHLMEALKQLSRLENEKQNVQLQALKGATDDIMENFDTQHGGLGGAPKFPQTMALAFLLQMYFRTQNEAYRNAVQHSLMKMAQGGIHDHLAGGFARYSVDERWAVPHFEKMLYDNALLSVLYFEGFQACKEPYFKEVGMGILDYVLHEMTSPQGSFYSSQDADSEGEEGKYYVWDLKEIEEVLGREDAQWVARYFGVDQAGNFEHGKTVLSINRERAILAEELKISEKELQSRLEACRKKMLQARKKRIAPARDEKILTSWNALMIRGFVKGYQVTADTRYLHAAEKAAAYILEHLTDSKQNDRLLATAKDDLAKLPAYLDDFAFFTASLLDLFLVTGKKAWFDKAVLFNQATIKHFIDEKGIGFFFTADDHEQLIDRPKSFYDGSIPSGNSVALENLLRLHRLTDRAEYGSLLEKNVLGLFSGASKRALGMTNFLRVADEFLGPGREVVLVSGKDSREFEDLRNRLWSFYLPRTIILLKVTQEEGIELLRGKDSCSGKATVFLCEAKTCSEPMTDFEELSRKLLFSK